MTRAGFHRYLVVLVLAASGCTGTSRLRAPERTGEERSLLFGSIRLDMDSRLTLEELVMERVSPAPLKEIVIENGLLADAKLLQGGFFLVPNVPPGVYRLRRVCAGLALFSPSEEDGEVMRVEVTEPGIYDVGAYQISLTGGLSAERRPDHASRYSVLLSATRGTRWEAAARSLAGTMVVNDQ